jgi:hypothetical protein
MIKVSVWYRRGAFLAVTAACCGGCGGALPGANQGVGVDYWRPVRQVLALCLPCACLVLGAVLPLTSGVLVKLLL